VPALGDEDLGRVTFGHVYGVVAGSEIDGLSRRVGKLCQQLVALGVVEVERGIGERPIYE